ncbi:MAG TPA: PKD domain-containing protein, partial [Puia sp.]
MFRKLRILSFLVLTAVYSGYAQAPAVSIAATPISGCAPLAVSFTGSATNSPTSYSWNFGGVPPNVSPAGSTSSNTAALYSTPGTYTVTFTATNASGTSAPATKTITVYPAPNADFNVDKTTGCFPTTVNFTNISSAGGPPGPVGTIVGWIWDFGDGNLDSTNYNPSHLYQFGGSFPVTLAVRNNFGCSGKASVKNVSQAITLAPGVFPDFSTAINSSCTLPVATSFTNQTTGPPNLSYVWDFGDASPPDNTVSPNHNFAAAGTYTVQLVANSSAGCSDTLRTPVTISANGNVSDFTGAGNVCINSQANFVNTSAPSPTSANWDYGDGSSSNSISGQHTYSIAGTYT